MKKSVMYVLMTLTMLVSISIPVSAADTYEAIYADAFREAYARHTRMLDNGELFTPYDAIGYTLADITGDGIYELLFRQVISKHYAEYWVYSCNGYDSYYMGDFGCDAHLMYGYQSGVLYRESYKGSVTLGLAEWTGSGFATTILYDGTYDRDGEPPAIWDLSDYYDPGRLLAEIPEFVTLDTDLPVLQIKCGETDSSAVDEFNLSGYAYRTVKTDNTKGALVFQTAPNGSFMNEYEFWNGDRIYVNLSWRQDGYSIAYQNGVYGYVDANYINW